MAFRVRLSRDDDGRPILVLDGAPIVGIIRDLAERIATTTIDYRAAEPFTAEVADRINSRLHEIVESEKKKGRMPADYAVDISPVYPLRDPINTDPIRLDLARMAEILGVPWKS